MERLYAVVSLLDAAHYGQVERMYGTPFPHFSYQVAAGYDLGRLEKGLRRIARLQPPFRVGTSGLGVFTGQAPVVYIAVVRSPELTRLHGKLWPVAERVANGALDYYRPEHWVPHITVGGRAIRQEDVSDVVRELMHHDYHWEIEVDNLAVISSSEADGFRLHLRVPLAGAT
ncbi:MAG TPA: 2'-5' RNA ligase family protein [Symbiobacteriaceae bacterium]|nr:2'-5' RNA ligase family protein [Symbiobacteriaceae bacterium]